MAQRLVRKLCGECSEPGKMSPLEMRRLNVDQSQLASANIRVPNGCRECRLTGFKGRMGIFEIFNIDDEVSKLINDGLTTPQLRKRARELGMRTLREDGVRKIMSGSTSASEIVRVTMQDSN